MSKQPPKYLEQPPKWADDERPVIPGSPPALDHTRSKRYAYFVIGTFIAITASLSNGFITANLPQLQGEYGLTPSEGAWLPCVYVMANVSANIILFKTRQQYGLRLFTEISLLCFIAVMLLHLFVQDSHMALIIRCISGFVAAPLSSLGLYYIMQSFGKLNRLKGIYVGFGFNQLGIPLAWILSPLLVNANHWANLYTFELGLAICCFAMVVAIKLPRGLRVEVIEKKDFITFLLLAPGFACLCAVLSQGPILWWFDSTWLAYVLMIGFSLVILGFFFEHQRSNPLILTRWLGTVSVLRFVIGAFFLRFLLSEQSFTAVNFLKIMGMGQDQFIGLYSVIFIGILAGTLFSAITFSKNHIFWPLLLATLLILIACRLDAYLTNDVRPQNFFYSQLLIAFANGLFIGPLLLTGIMRTLKQGPNYVITFIILFSATQNFGSLVGSSFYNTYQKHQAQVYQRDIEQTLNQTDPNVTNRINQYTAVYRPHLTDSMLEQAEASQLLAQVVSREAQVRAYNDVVNINSIIAILLFLWTLIYITWQKYITQRKKNFEAQP